MDLNAIWAEHKRFILGVGAALLVFFIATRILNAMYVRPTKRLDMSTESASAKLRRRPAPTTGDLREQRKVGTDLDERLAAVESRVAFEVNPSFVLAPGSDFDLVYNDRFREVRDEVMGRAAVDGVMIDPSFGMPESTPSERAEVQRILKALDVIRDVLDRALVAGVDAVPEIRVPSAGRKGFLAARTYLEEIRAEFEVTGDADAVMALVASLQTGGRFLTVWEARGEQLDPRNPGRVRVRLEIVALEIDPDAPALEVARNERDRKRDGRDRESRRR